MASIALWWTSSSIFGIVYGVKKVDHCVSVGFIHCGFVVCGSGRRQPPASDAAGTVQWLIRWEVGVGGGQVQTAPLQLPMGLLICPSWGFPPFSDCGRKC